MRGFIKFIVMFVMIIAGGSLPVLSVSAEDLVGNARAGEKIFKRKCKACHTVDQGGKKRVGPNLFAVFGAVPGQKEGYKYSKAMIAFGKEQQNIWDAATLALFLTKPKKLVTKTKMSFAGLKKQVDRDNMVAYLRSLQ